MVQRGHWTVELDPVVVTAVGFGEGADTDTAQRLGHQLGAMRQLGALPRQVLLMGRGLPGTKLRAFHVQWLIAEAPVPRPR